MFSFLFPKKNTVPRDEIKQIVEVDTQGLDVLYKSIESYTGITLDMKKELLQNKIISLCKEESIESFYILIKKLKSETNLWNKLIELITINETYFFREKAQLSHALLEYKHIDSLSILCAPSSSGEEVYSITILALEMGLTNFHVTGIDISETVIHKAKNGLYSQRSVHRVPKILLDKYFHHSKSSYKIDEKIKRYTSFIESNLFDKKTQNIGKFDLIFSRNMFIYFNDEKKIEAYKCLSGIKKDKNSKIFLGHADISSELSAYIKKTIKDSK